MKNHNAIGKTALVLVGLFLLVSMHSYAQTNTYVKLRLDRADRLLYAEADSEKEALSQIKEAKEIVDELLEDYDDSPEVLVKAAEISSEFANFDSLGDEALPIMEKGEEYADKAIELDPDNSYAYFYKATLIGQLGLKKGILSSLSKVKPMRDNLLKTIELNPDFAPAYDVLAILYQSVPGWPISIGNDGKALENRLKTVELEPTNINYLMALYNLYKDMNKMNEAKELLLDVQDIDFGNTPYSRYEESIKQYVSEELKKLNDKK